MAQHNNKRKPKEIHVDKLIIKADRVIIENEEHHEEKHEEKREEREERRPVREEFERDPWGFPLRPMPGPEDRERGEEGDSDNEDKGEEREDRRGSWF